MAVIPSPSKYFTFNGSSFINIDLETDALPLFNVLASNTSDFTVEWYQNMKEDAMNSFPRVFSIGSYSGANAHVLGVSIESGTIYVWRGDDYIISVGFPVGKQYDQWSHFAITKEGTSVKLYVNGENIESGTSNASFVMDGALHPSLKQLIIGAEYGSETDGVVSADNMTFFNGDIYGFHILQNEIKYTANFTPVFPLITDNTNTLLFFDVNSSEELIELKHTTFVINGTLTYTYEYSEPEPVPEPPRTWRMFGVDLKKDEKKGVVGSWTGYGRLGRRRR
jgi:hypothetical protein